jgi:hypothetical protein
MISCLSESRASSSSAANLELPDLSVPPTFLRFSTSPLETLRSLHCLDDNTIGKDGIDEEMRLDSPFDVRYVPSLWSEQNGQLSYQGIRISSVDPDEYESLRAAVLISNASSVKAWSDIQLMKEYIIDMTAQVRSWNKMVREIFILTWKLTDSATTKDSDTVFNHMIRSYQAVGWWSPWTAVSPYLEVLKGRLHRSRLPPLT